MLHMLATIVSFSDEDMEWMLIILGLLGLILMSSGMIGIAKAKKEAAEREQERERRASSPPQQKNPFPEDTPAWKRVELEESKREQTTHKCIFCGAAMTETQTFCGSCGRRKD